MAKTLVDEPPPPTLSEPGNRPTLDDIPAENRPTLDDIPGERRGPSPTLIDPPAPAAAPRRGAATLADGPPHASRTPAAAPLHVAQDPAPQARFVTTAESATGPAPQPKPAPPVTVGLPVPPAPALPAGPPPPAALPAAAAPPPLAYPAGGGQGPGLLAQLPAMPSNRAPVLPGPALSPAAPPVAAAAQQAPPQQASSQQAPPQQAPPQQAPPQQASSQQASSQQTPPQQAAPQQAPAPAAGAPRVAAGGRTLLGVAPPPAAHAAAPPGARSAQTASQSTSQAPGQSQAQSGIQYSPPGQTSNPDPLSATMPVEPGLVPPAAGNGAPPAGPDAAGAPSPDASSAAPADSPSPAPRKSGARTIVAAAVAVIGLLAIVAVVVGYFVFFRYTPLAERHIPAQSNVALRADVRQIGTFAPVRKHLWPLLVDRPSQKTQGKTLADKVAEATGIHPALDVREVIVASVDSRSWVALVGGNFTPGTFVPGMEKVLQEEGYTGWQRSGDLLVGPGGIALAQAEDGTLVIGTEAEIVTSALPATEDHHRMNLPTNSALSFAVTKEAWEELSREAGAFDAAGSLRRIRHVRGTLSLGDEPAIDIDVEPKGGENADALGKDVETMLAALRLFLVLAPDRMGEKAALSAAKVAVEDQHVRVRAAWPLEGLDRACADLAARLGR